MIGLSLKFDMQHGHEKVTEECDIGISYNRQATWGPAVKGPTVGRPMSVGVPPLTLVNHSISMALGHTKDGR